MTHQLEHQFLASFAMAAEWMANTSSDALSVRQIGANYWVRDDHVRSLLLKHRLRAVLVEPIPATFEKLKKNCEGLTHVQCINVAIGEPSGSLRLWMPRQAESSDHGYDDRFASFSRSLLLSTLGIPDAEDAVTFIDVPTLSFSQLCDQAGVHQPDIVVIDAEGFDFQILKQIDFRGSKPRLIHFEIQNLSSGDCDAAVELLTANGYRWAFDGINITAMSGDSDNGLQGLSRSNEDSGP